MNDEILAPAFIFTQEAMFLGEITNVFDQNALNIVARDFSFENLLRIIELWDIEAVKEKRPLDYWTNYKLVVYFECQRCKEWLYYAPLTTEHFMTCEGFGKLFATPLPENLSKSLQTTYSTALTVNIESLRRRNFVPYFAVYKEL